MRIKHHVTIGLVILFSNFHFGFSDESYNCLNDSDYAYIFAYVDENHTIRLNVTALEPIDKAILSSSCPQSNFFEQFLDKNRKNSIIIPNIYTTLILMQNCPYNVIIHNKNETCHNISYVIPECVDGQCCNIHDPPLRIVHVEPVKTMEDWYNVSLKRTRNFTFFGTNITYHLKHINAEFYDLGMDIHDESLNLTYDSQLIRLNNLIEGEKYEIVLTYYENYTCEASDIFIYTVEKDQSLIFLLLIGTLIVLSWAICCIIKYNKPIFTYLKKLIYNPQPETIEIQDLPLKKSLIPETKFKPNPNYIEHDIYEIEKTYIHIENEIGHGTFGQVCYGKLTKPGEPSIAVAIKKLRNTTEDNCVSFENEIKLMKKIGHHENVVQFMGCCTKTEPYLIVMEFVPGTNLKKYLDDLNKIWKLKEQELSKTRMFFPDNMVIPPQTTYTFYNEERKLSVDMPSPGILSMRPLLDHIQEFQRKNSIDSSPNTVTSYVLTSTPNSAHKSEISETELQDFAVQIAKGMEYLESVNVTHRDLAARNILITPEKQLKISDFGMSRIGNYVLRKSAEIPLKWTSIEGITRGEFTSKNDVWAFAVVLWEIGTLGEDPWGDLTTPSVLEKKLLNGERLQRPDICTEELYELMLKCWSFDPINRPTFKEIVQKINTDQKIYNTMLFHPTHQILEENVEENKN